MRDECRLLVDQPAPGDWNMAVDEMLLDWAAEHGAACLRFYQWEKPTLSLGYFQSYEDRWDHAASRDCPVVRRLTGGGAILHDAELTYSLVLPAQHRLARNRDALYDTVHRSLIETLASWGIHAAILGQTLATRRVSVLACPPADVPAAARDQKPAGDGSPLNSHVCGTEPFLCFQRRTAGDVVVGDVKIAGSAQRRRRGAVLQHGSVLLRRSPAAPELPGIEEVTRQAISPLDLVHVWKKDLGDCLGARWYPSVISEEESSRAALLATRYAGNRAAGSDRCLPRGIGQGRETDLVKPVPEYEIRVYGNRDELPAEAEELFARQLADSRRPLPSERPDRDRWRFALTCAVAGRGHVLGGVYLDIGPINGAGPLAQQRLAYLERTLVRREYRRQGLATELLRRSITVASEAGCEYIRCSNNWDNPPETALLRKCGFALVDLNGEEDDGPCYLAVRPLRNLGA
jgi:lipoate-protein ligase A